LKTLKKYLPLKSIFVAFMSDFETNPARFFKYFQ